MNDKEQVTSIQRYKIGYHTDEWGMRSSTPSGIQDASGLWVRYSDHGNVITSLHARIAELEDVADMAIKRIEELEAQLSATITAQAKQGGE